ncbi:MAG: DUF1697 domain-containing protein [Planctomycetes bacterium]|nr:DUF1697 domain-containing protein [Planctomycetota bacterium]
MTQFVALLRGINVGAAGKGRKSVAMPKLRDLVEGLGATEVETYLQTGNVLFAAEGTPAAWEARIEEAVARRFHCDVAVLVRPLEELVDIASTCPFVDAAEERPNLVHVGFAKQKIAPAMADSTEKHWRNGECVTVRGQAIWADYAEGVAQSRLTPGVLERAFGSPVTLRNVKTLRALVEMAAP